MDLIGGKNNRVETFLAETVDFYRDGGGFDGRSLVRGGLFNVAPLL